MNSKNASTLAALITLALTLAACSGPQANATPDPDPAVDENTTAEGDAPQEEAPKSDAIKIAAQKMKGPFASLEAFAQAEGATILLADEASAVTEGKWATQGGVLTIGESTRHVLLGGESGNLYVLDSSGSFTIDTSNTTPDQLQARAIIREASVPNGYVLFEHIVDYVDPTQSGEAHDVLGYSHLCRPHDGGMACARFTTQVGAYLVKGDEDPGYEMPNAVIKDVEGKEHTLELFYMNGGPGMDAQGFYEVTLP